MSVAPNPVVIASSAADVAAVDAVVSHHAELSGALETHVQTVFSAVINNDVRGAEHERAALVAWCGTELVPHALAEEAALYPAARQDPRGRLLIDAMLAEHAILVELVEAIRKAVNPVVVAANAHALRIVFASHLAKENELILPLLASSPDVSLAAALEGMRASLRGDDGDAHEAEVGVGEASEAPAGGGSCGCGGHDEAGFPELDATTIPHAIRHATIFGALEAVGPGGGLVLLAPHAPLPLLRQISDRWPGRFEVSYLEEGPEIWKLQFRAA